MPLLPYGSPVVKGLPKGGTTNQSLVKNSNSNYDTKWMTISGTGGPETDPVFNAWLLTNPLSGYLTTISGLNHASLNNLNYASSGHTGFQPAGSYLTTISGLNISLLNNDIPYLTTISGLDYNLLINKPTNLNQFTNGPGYLTVEVDTLDSVVSRGNYTTSTANFQNATAIILGKIIPGTPGANQPGVLKLISAGDNTYYTTFTAPTQTANETYTLPTAMPDTNKILQSSSVGVLSWITIPTSMVWPSGAGIAVYSGSGSWSSSISGTSSQFVKGDGSLDSSTYLTSVTAHNILSTTHGDTLADSVHRGDILYGNATPAWARLPFPASPTGKVIQATATDVAWSTNPLTIGTSASVSGSNTGDQTIASLGLDADLATFSLPANTTITTFGASLIDDAAAVNAIATLGLDADIATLSLPASTTITAAAATILDDVSIAAINATLGTLANPMTTEGDLIIGGASGAPKRLADVAVNQVLVSGGVGADPAWSGTPTFAGLTLTGALARGANAITGSGDLGATGTYIGNAYITRHYLSSNVYLDGATANRADLTSAAGFLSLTVPTGVGWDTMGQTPFSEAQRAPLPYWRLAEDSCWALVQQGRLLLSKPLPTK